MSLFSDLFGFEIISSDDADALRNQTQAQMHAQMAAFQNAWLGDTYWLTATGFMSWRDPRRWSDAERASRLKQFDLDRAAFRPSMRMGR